ncbi:RNA recognition domain-containing protein [Xylaria scruposa]|nr:RNA recognition domain-containing protein [Xylaria scruposa]
MRMESSRVFVRGLPPTISEAELRKHFSAKGHVSDIKCFPQRRIGYVGFKTPQEASAAVKYFNRSFIRMSKINVELAKPIADRSRSKTESPNDLPTSSSKAEPTQQTLPSKEQPDNTAKKRKRDALDESDPKLQEFLSLMQASKISADQLHRHEDDAILEPPSKKVAAVDEDESGDEYQSMPTEPRRKITTPPPRIAPRSPKEAQTVSIVDSTMNEAAAADELVEPVAASASQTIIEAQGTGADDDDWLRKRTNRLLDLADDDEVVPVGPQPTASKPADHEMDYEDLEHVTPEKAAMVEGNTVTAPEQILESTDSRDVATLDAIRKTARIFCRNLPYDTTAEDLRTHFEKFGEVEEVHVPSDASNKNRGMGFILFHDPEAAVNAFQSDRTTFQGRILHVLPAKAKTDDLDEFALAKLPLKQQNLIKKRKKAAASTWSWNSLYMSQDAVNTSVADRLGVSKSELLDPTSSDAGVKQALAESEIIQDTKAYFTANGVNLDSFKSKPRSDDVILVKNLDANTKSEEIRTLFEEHGRVLRVLIPPTGVIAIVQFSSPSEGKRAFAKLAYRRFGSSQLFLEKAPRDIFFDSKPASSGDSTTQPAVIEKVSASDLLEEHSTQSSQDANLFVKNLNFDTDTNALAEAFQHLEGFKSALVKTKKDMKRPGQTLSMGFGFVSFENSDLAAAAAKVMDGHVLTGHKLHVRASHRGLDAAEERKKKEEIASKATCTLIVKNLPFQASKREIKALFSAYSQIKAVRMPKKFNHSGRGFAFVDFTSSKDAASALQALEGTHLLGRRLILQYAEAEAVDAEEEIAKMQKKVGGQVNKVALQELTGQGRKKFNVGGDRDEGD